jgi:16S rRNA (adenine1518-N6/adenine1519-N6)-dimethyltransferase
MVQYKKSLGQHILQNVGAAKRIVDSLDLSDGDSVLEIGPGNGALTSILVRHPIRLVAIELDERMTKQLKERLGETNRLQIVNDDILKCNLGILAGNSTWKVVGNLPYNITSSILKKVFDNRSLFSTAVFTVQKEVADRMTASAGSADYSSLTVFTNTYCHAKKLFHLRPGSFFPPPKVSSAVVHLTFRDRTAVAEEHLERFSTFVQALFSHRRKTILNSLAMVTSIDKEKLASILERVDIPTASRPQTISVEKYALLFTAIDRSNRA